METDYLVSSTVFVLFTILVTTLLHFGVRFLSRAKHEVLQHPKEMGEGSEDVTKQSRRKSVDSSEEGDCENSEMKKNASAETDVESNEKADFEEPKTCGKVSPIAAVPPVLREAKKTIKNDIELRELKNGSQRNMDQYLEENEANLHLAAQRKGTAINEDLSRQLESLDSKIALAKESLLLADEPQSLSDIVDKDTDTNQEEHIRHRSTIEPELVVVDKVFEPAILTVQRNGLEFKSPYCEVIFPQNAVQSKLAVEVTPHYNVEVGMPGKILATVVVGFRSADPLVFRSNVRVKLRTPYTSLPKGKPVDLEIVKSEKYGEFKTFATAKLENDCFVSFWCKSFCRVAAVMNRPDASRTEKRYYMAAITRNPTESASFRKINWMVCEDMPNTTALNKIYFDINDHRRVICAQTFYLGPNCELRLQLKDEGWLGVPGTDEAGSSRGTSVHPPQQPFVEIWPEHAEIGAHGNYKLGFDQKREFSVAVRKKDDKTQQKLTYRLHAVDVHDRIRSTDVMKSTCTLDWSMPTDTAKPLTVNAYGANSTGLNINLPSGYGTSGYGSDRHVNPAAGGVSRQMVSDIKRSVRNHAADSRSVDSVVASHFRIQAQTPSVAELRVESLGASSQMTTHPAASEAPDIFVAEESVHLDVRGSELNISRTRTPRHCEHDPQVGSSVEPVPAVDVHPSGPFTVVQQAREPIEHLHVATPHNDDTHPKEPGPGDFEESARAGVLE